jgi:hypothetical protein
MVTNLQPMLNFGADQARMPELFKEEQDANKHKSSFNQRAASLVEYK